MAGARSIYRLAYVRVPIPIFPCVGQAIYVHAHKKEDRSLYFAKIDADGNISSFERTFENSLKSAIPVLRSPLIRSPGDPALFPYLLSGLDIRIAESKADLIALLQSLIKRAEFLFSPFSGIEAARFVADSAAELLYTKRAAALIASSNRHLAHSWLDAGFASPEARAATKALLASEKIPEFFDHEAVERPLRILAEHATKQVALLRGASVIVKVVEDAFMEMSRASQKNAYDAVILHSTELVKNFSERASETIRGWRAQGVLTILIADDARWDLPNISAAKECDIPIDASQSFVAQIKVYRIIRRLGSHAKLKSTNEIDAFIGRHVHQKVVLSHSKHISPRLNLAWSPLRVVDAGAISHLRQMGELEDGLIIIIEQEMQRLQEIIGELRDGEIQRSVIVNDKIASGDVPAILQRGFVDVVSESWLASVTDWILSSWIACSPINPPTYKQKYDAGDGPVGT